MSVLYVLDIDDFRPLAEVAAKNPDVTVVKRGPYYEVTCDTAYEIERNATGCRNAIWFSAVAAVTGGIIETWNKSRIHIQPMDSK
jgi:hypothetical protein